MTMRTTSIFRWRRVPFDRVAGVSSNALAVGARLERIYGREPAGGVAGLLGDLFLLDDVGDYNRVLSSLAGAGYANYLQSFQSLGVRYNSLADEATGLRRCRAHTRDFPIAVDQVRSALGVQLDDQPAHRWKQSGRQHQRAPL